MKKGKMVHTFFKILVQSRVGAKIIDIKSFEKVCILLWNIKLLINESKDYVNRF